MHTLKNPKIIFYLCSGWLIVNFLFIPHYVELTGVLETWFVQQGLVYYRDFSAYHFPLGRLVLLPLHILSDWNLEYDPLLALLIAFGTMLVILKFGSKHLGEVGTSIALIFFSLFYWYAATGILFFHEQLIGLLLAIIIYLVFQTAKSVTTLRNLFLIGFFCSLTVLSGQLAVITVGTISLLLLVKANQNLKSIVAKTKALAFLAGLILPFALVTIYFLTTGGLYEFYFYNVPYYFLYANYKKSSLLSLPILDLFVFYLPLVLLSLNLGHLLLNRVKIKKNYIYTFILSASTIPFVLFSIYHPHHLNFALPVLALTAGWAYKSHFLDKKHTLKWVTIPLLLFGLFIITTSIITWHTERYKDSIQWRIANDLYPDSQDPMQEAVLWIKNNTTGDARIMVMGDALFYLRSNRLPSARPAKGMPYAWNPMTQVEQELVSQRPRYWIISERFLERMINYYSRQDIYDFMNKEIDTCFEKIAEFEDWKIWRKRCE